MPPTDGPPGFASPRELFARLIAFASVSREPSAPIVEYVAGLLERAGCRVHRFPYDHGRKVNLLAVRGPKTEGGLLISGHLDVVPADEPEWRADPFVLREADGHFVGRGAVDMKGFVALAIAALIRASDAELRCPLAMLLTADEEVGSRGAQAFLRDWDGRDALPRSVLVGEPTNQRVVRMHKGHLRMRLVATGRSAHSGYPHLGDNAIERAARAIATLSQFAQRLKSERADTSAYFPECPHPALNIATIAGGRAANIVPDRCEILLGMRLLPGQDPAQWFERTRTALDELAPQDRAAVALELDNDSPPMLCPETAPVCAAAMRLANQSETLGVSYSTDAGVLSRQGFECILLGPGDMERAHKPEEALPIDAWNAFRPLLDRLIGAMCGAT